MTHPLRTAAAVCTAVLLAACGSTVQVRGTASAGGDGEGLGGSGTAGTGLVQGGSAGGGSGGTATTGTGSSGAGGGAQGSSGSTSGGGPQGATAGGGSVGTTGSGGTSAPVLQGAESGKGFTRTTITFGVATSSDYNKFASSVGLKGVGYDGDPNVWYDAIAADINAHGGVLGRKVKLVKYNYDAAQYLSNQAAANQEACTSWTQDGKVAAVLLVGFIAEDTMLKCLANAKTPLVQVGGGLEYPLHYAETYRKYPLFFNLDQMVGDRFDRVAIGRLVARDFFHNWNTRTGQATSGTATVGIVGFDDHDGALQLASEQKELAAHKVKVETTVACPRDLTSKVSCEQSAVLKMASSGVTHVLGADSTFMSNANSQGYYPRYFVAVEPALFAANVPAKQLVGAMGEGYDPFLDADPSAYPGDPSAATGRCKRIMKAAGQATTDPLTLWLQMSLCDAFTFTRDAARAGGSLTSSGLQAGLERLGSTSPSAMAFNSLLSADNHASATLLRDLAFRPDLGSFVYTSKTNYGASQ